MSQRLPKVYFATLIGVAVVYSLFYPESLYLTVPITLLIGLFALSLKPSNLNLGVLVALCALGFGIGHSSTCELIYWVVLPLYLIFSVIDICFLLFQTKFSVERELPGRFAQGQDGEVKLKINNLTSRACRVNVFDGIPQHAESSQMPWSGIVPARGYNDLTYEANLNIRGIATFTRTHIECLGPLFLWKKATKDGITDDAKVYPNYEPVLQLSLLSMESNPEQMGIIKKNRAGLSKEFHQLRDYHKGDTLSQIDWKASSKRQALISRSYQEQRDQNVILAIDCGRRMRALDGKISQFDHCLNAILLLAYVALKQGDNVGIMAYGGSDRWLPPVKGLNSMTTILNHLYDYKTSSSPSDYGEAAERLMQMQKRRAMVVFVSNFRGEDTTELVEPLRRIRKKHITCIGNIREREVDEVKDQEVSTLDEAIRLASVQHYLDARSGVMDQLRQFGIPSVDATAQDLPVALANQYLELREMV